MKKKPKKQDQYLAYATDSHSGRPLNIDKPDSTLSRDIEIGANGPPKTRLQITVTHNDILAVVSPANAEYNDSGRYFMDVVGLKVGVNYFGLRANSSTSPSDTWELTVVSTLPELIFDESDVDLSGTRYFVHPIPPQFSEYAHPSNPLQGSYIDRPATGGVAPITYSSSNIDIASINQNGRVFARANGTVRITARDSANQTKSFNLTTSGLARQVVCITTQANWENATQIATSNNGRLFSLTELQSVYMSFTPAEYQMQGSGHHSWTSTSAGTAGYWILQWSGVTQTHLDRPDYTGRFAYLKL